MNKALFGFKQNPSYSLRSFRLFRVLLLEKEIPPRFLLYCFFSGESKQTSVS